MTASPDASLGNEEFAREPSLGRRGEAPELAAEIEFRTRPQLRSTVGLVGLVRGPVDQLVGIVDSRGRVFFTDIARKTIWMWTAENGLRAVATKD